MVVAVLEVCIHVSSRACTYGRGAASRLRVARKAFHHDLARCSQAVVVLVVRVQVAQRPSLEACRDVHRLLYVLRLVRAPAQPGFPYPGIGSTIGHLMPGARVPVCRTLLTRARIPVSWTWVPVLRRARIAPVRRGRLGLRRARLVVVLVRLGASRSYGWASVVCRVSRVDRSGV